MSVVLPDPPSFEELAAHLFGPNGCYLDPDVPYDPMMDCKGDVDSLEIPISELPETVSVKVLGYTGPLYSTTVSSDPDAVPVVLTETVTVRDGEVWGAIGLVRNDRGSVVDAIRVTATLFDGNGNVLGSVEREAAVPGVRPGEPVPFELRSDVTKSKVGNVGWKAEAVTTNADVERSITAGVFATYNPDRTERINLGSSYEDSGEPPYPYIVDMTLTGYNERTIKPTLIVAWINRRTGALVAGPTPAEFFGLVREFGLDPVTRVRLSPGAPSSTFPSSANAHLIDSNPLPVIYAPATDIAIWGYGV